jgi:hypothetical protein
MDVAISEALDVAARFSSCIEREGRMPSFVVDPVH